MKLIIIGAGETALLAYQYFEKDSNYTVECFMVEERYISDHQDLPLPILPLEALSRFSKNDYRIFVAISSRQMNQARERIYLGLKSSGFEFATYISSRAFVWPNVKVGENTLIMEHNTLQPYTSVGNNVILWSGNHIGHRSVIGDNAFISSHCVVSGYVTIGKNSFLGVNCTIEDEVEIGDYCFIGAGSLIRRNLADFSLTQSEETAPSRVDTKRMFRLNV